MYLIFFIDNCIKIRYIYKYQNQLTKKDNLLERNVIKMKNIKYIQTKIRKIELQEENGYIIEININKEEIKINV